MGTEPNPVTYSIVVPLYNEQESVPQLYVKIIDVMDTIGDPFEIVFVDDGSRDGTLRQLSEIARDDARVLVVCLRRNFGQTAALKAGFDHCQGEIIISMDGDLQHDPAEIPKFIEKMKEGYDIVSGWRVARTDAWLTRRIPSRVANGIMAKLSRVELHDFGTTFKAYRREIISEINLYGELHRFIPALASWAGATIAEVPITNVPRKSGKSNYGISRTIRVLLDLDQREISAGLLDSTTAIVRLGRADRPDRRRRNRDVGFHPQGFLPRESDGGSRPAVVAWNGAGDRGHSIYRHGPDRRASRTHLLRGAE